MTRQQFPEGFLWGTASASHQVEGNNHNNQWWAFEQKPGAIWNDDKSGLACDWWRNAERDFDQMQSLSLNAHRLSVEWSRIEPRPGEFDPTAIERYRQMLDGLRRRGITPMVTLHHFSNPLWLEAKGGWENPETISRFQRFVRYTVTELSDLCSVWCTINEPTVYIAMGWILGYWPPQHKDFFRAMRVLNLMVRAHAAAYHAIHAVQPTAQVGYATHSRLFTAQRPRNQLDKFAAWLKRYMLEHVWSAGVHDGKILPPAGRGVYDPRLANTADFVGINYYTRDHSRFTPNPFLLFGQEKFEDHTETTDHSRLGPFSQYSPDGLYQVCHEARKRKKPIYITENGFPDADDNQRGRWLVGYLSELQRAIKDGCDVRGYFHWTLVDNFEWAEGWGLRFGLIELDPQTQERKVRPSASVYARIAQENAIYPYEIYMN